MKAYELSLAISPDHSAIAWHGGITGRDAVYFQRLNSAGKPAGAPRQITDGQRYAFEPDLQPFGSDYLLAWYEKDDAGALTAWLGRLDADGQPVWRHQLDAAHGFARNPVVRVAQQHIWVAWIESSSAQDRAVWVEQVSAEGATLHAARRAGDASSNTWNLNAAVDATGAFYVAYDAKLNTKTNELRLAIIDDYSVRNVALSADDGFDSVYPDIGINSDGATAITWFDARDGNNEIYLAVQPLNNLLAAQPLRAQRITNTPASSIGAYLAWNGDRLAIVWCDATPGQSELYAQTFTSSGVAISSIQRLTQTSAESSIPSIRPFGKGYLIAWNEYVTTGQTDHTSIVSSAAEVKQLP